MLSTKNFRTRHSAGLSELCQESWAGAGSTSSRAEELGAAPPVNAGKSWGAREQTLTPRARMQHHCATGGENEVNEALFSSIPVFLRQFPTVRGASSFAMRGDRGGVRHETRPVDKGECNISYFRGFITAQGPNNPCPFDIFYDTLKLLAFTVLVWPLPS